MKSIKWLLLCVLLFVIIGFIIYLFDGLSYERMKICQDIETLAKNLDSGRCYYNANSCIPEGYVKVTELECDCDNLEYREWQDVRWREMRAKRCTERKEFWKKFESTE